MASDLDLLEFIGKMVDSELSTTTNNYEPKENQFRISTLAYCSRRIYYDKMHPDLKQLDYNSKGSMVVGNILHDFLEGKLPSDKDLAIELEVSYKYKDIELIGHPDIVLPDKVVDIKTCSNNSFGYRVAESIPTFHHFYQVNIYANILEKPFVTILYVNKENLETVERGLPVEKRYFEQALEKAQEIYGYVSKKELPPRDPQEDWECRYCPYVKSCYKEEEC